MIRTSCAWAYRGSRIKHTSSLGSVSLRQRVVHSPSPLRTAIPCELRRYSHDAATKTSVDGTLNKTTATPAPQSSTKADSEPPVPPPSQLQKSIPGPSWLWLEPICTPFRAYGRLHQRGPLLTQFVSALVIYFIGDMVAQSMGGAELKKDDVTSEEEEEDNAGWVQSWAQDRDWNRTGRALIIGGLSAIPGYKWFLWLSNSFNYSSKIGSLVVKVMINQVTFTPLFNSYFFGMQYVLSGTFLSSSSSTPPISISGFVTHVQNTVPTSWYNSCKIWPAVTAFSFAFVNLEYRSLVAGVVAIGWQTYLSLLDARARTEEAGKGLEVVAGKDEGNIAADEKTSETSRVV